MNLLSKLKSKNSKVPETKKQEKTSRTLNNPFLAARRTWNDYISSQVAQRKMWQVVALIALMGCLLCIMGIIYIGSLSKVQPYIIEVDSFNRSKFEGFLPQYANNSIDERVITVLLSDFIYDSRSVSSDPDVQMRNINRLFSKLTNTDTAYSKLVETLNSESKYNPFTRARTETVDIKINSILKISQNSYQIEWSEVLRDRKNAGQITNTLYFKSIVNIKFVNTKDFNFAQLQRNPLGLYVTDFSIQQMLPAKEKK